LPFVYNGLAICDVGASGLDLSENGLLELTVKTGRKISIAPLPRLYGIKAEGHSAVRPREAVQFTRLDPHGLIVETQTTGYRRR